MFYVSQINSNKWLIITLKSGWCQRFVSIIFVLVTHKILKIFPLCTCIQRKRKKRKTVHFNVFTVLFCTWNNLWSEGILNLWGCMQHIKGLETHPIDLESHHIFRSNVICPSVHAAFLCWISQLFKKFHAIWRINLFLSKGELYWDWSLSGQFFDHFLHNDLFWKVDIWVTLLSEVASGI